MLERILLTKPDYIRWILTVSEPDWKLQHLREEVRRLAIIFDRKPLLCKCRGIGCGKPCTRLSIPDHGYSIHYFCDDCPPEVIIDYAVELEFVYDFVSAVNLENKHREGYFGPDSPLLSLAYAKGLKKTLYDSDLEAFFHVAEPEPNSAVETEVQIGC